MKNMTQDKTRIAIIVAMAIFALVMVGWMFFSSANPTPAQMSAQAARSEALAVEYQGESILVQAQSELVRAKADLVNAYPQTLKEAGLAAVKLGSGVVLVALGIGALGLLFAMAASLVMRSAAYAYTDVQKSRVLSDLQFANPARNPLLGGADSSVIDYSEIFKRTDAARTGGGGTEGAVSRHTDRITIDGSNIPASAGTDTRKSNRK